MFKRITESFKAWRRGERRVAPHGVRGRVYEKKDPQHDTTGSGGGREISSRGTATLHMKVLRQDGTSEEIEVPATVKRI